MSPKSSERVLSKSDAASLAIFMVAGVAIAVWSVAAAVLRIIEVLPGRDVPVLAVFHETPAQAPIGPDGAAVTVTLESAWITASELPVASVWALVIQQIVQAGAIVTVVACLLLLTRNVMRGTVFSKRSTRLVVTAAVTALVGYALVPFFGNMGANGAFAMISDRTFDNIILSMDFLTFVVIAFIGALGSTAFTIGARLQRETEGLV